MIVALLVLIFFAMLFPGVFRAAFAFLALAFLWLWLTTPGHAGETIPGGAPIPPGWQAAPSADLPPRVDVDGRCEAGFGSRGEAAVRACRHENQQQYDLLKLVWADVTPETRAECTGQPAFNSAFPYTFLVACVLPRMERDAFRRQGKFRY